MIEHSRPASGIQRQFWLAQMLQPQTTAYHYATVWRIRGPLRVDWLQAAFAELSHRHESLRTTFEERDGVLWQDIHSKLDPDFAIEDCRVEVDGPETVAELKRPFDLVNGPLLRVRVFAASEEDYVVAWAVFHMVGDLTSNEIMGDELTVLYRLQLRGAPLSELPPPPRQYASFCDAETEWLESSARIEAEHYFRELGLAAVPPLALPSERPRPTTQSCCGAAVRLTASSDLTEAIERTAQALDSKTFLIWLAAYAFVVGRFSSENALVIGVPHTNRRKESQQNLVGCCVNDVPIRIDLSPDLTFAGLLKNLRQTMLKTRPHQSLPLADIVQAVRPPRDPSRSPIFQAGFTFSPPLKVELEQLHVEPFKPHPEGAQLDLFLTMWVDDHSRFAGLLEYAVEVVSEAVANRLGRSIIQLLEWVTADIGRCESVVEFPLSVADSASLSRWNATDVPSHSAQTLQELFEQQVSRSRASAAVRYAERCWNYGELFRLASGLARAIRDSGVAEGDLVGLYFERSFAMVLGIYGALLAGVTYVPIDPDHPWARVEHMLTRAQLKVVLLHEETRARWQAGGSPVPILLVDDVRPADAPPQRTTKADDAAYVIFTSGSTGKPKGCVNSHRGICNRLEWMQATFQLGQDDVILQKTPYTFDVSMWEFLWPLLSGACLEIAPPGLHRDPGGLIKLMQDARVTTVHFVPSMLGALLDAQATIDCASLRLVICSGEALSSDLVRRFCVASPAQLHNLYGPTEAAIDVTWWDCRNDVTRDPVPIGAPIANTQIHVLDHHLRPVPIGVPGELFIGGVQVGLGYVGEPLLTAERFIKDPFTADESARLYKTGDRACWNEDGTIAFLGRFDDQVKIRGLRIELGEIESVLDQQPQVRQSVVVARRLGSGTGDPQLCAYVTVTPDTRVEADELKRALRDMLPSYMVPQHVVILPSLPLNANGKVDRRALPDPTLSKPALKSVPANDIERWLVSQAGELVGHEFGVNENFFDAGGSSLTAAQLIGRIRKHFSREVPLVKIFEHPTIGQLAAYLSDLQSGARGSDTVVSDARARAEERLRANRRPSRR